MAEGAREGGGVILALLLAVATPTQASPPAALTPVPATDGAADPHRLAKARGVIALVIPEDQRRAMFETMVNGFMANTLSGMIEGNGELKEAFDQLPELRPVFATFVERQRKLALADLDATMPELMLAYERAYARLFSADDLDAMVAFFASPAGRRYVATSPRLISDPDFAAWQRGVAVRAQTRGKDEARRLMEEIAPILQAHGAKHHVS